MSYITTFTGTYFDPVNPEENLIEVKDIAHALSLLCRANGHMRFFYSVAQHAIACAKEAEARGLSKRIQFGCLLHDASEAYLSDITRPIKKKLTVYLEIESNLQNAIWNKFFKIPLTAEELKQIFEIDDDMLSYEFKHLMPEPINNHYEKIQADIQCEFVNPEKVEQEFLRLYEALISRQEN